VTATALAIYLVPGFFVAVMRWVESRRHRRAERAAPLGAQPTGE